MANIYREASLGNAVNIVVVRLIVLAEEQVRLAIDTLYENTVPL